MSANPSYGPFQASDIERYLNGEMSAEERHALEAATLEDPFLSDALEGMEKDRSSRGKEAYRQDLMLLKKHLEKRLERDKKRRSAIGLYFMSKVWKAAAAVIIIIGLGAITYRYVFDIQTPSPALARANKAVSSDSARKVESTPPPAPAPAPAQKIRAVEDRRVAAKTAPVDKEKYKSIKTEDQPSLSVMSPASSAASSGIAPPRLDTIIENKDLAKKSRFGADKAPNVLEAVTVRAAPSPQQAGPLNGWPAFQKYLDDHKQNGVVDSTLKGKESISFMINNKGNLSDFKIEESLSPAHDSLLERLIRQGSPWIIYDKKSARVTVTLSY